MTKSAPRNTVIAIVSFSVLLILCWLVYSPALSGTFLLDDRANLSGLKNVDNTRTALQFIVSGDSGPVGRPLALASFLPHAESMDANARPFIQFNILLHLLNACILAWFLYCLCLIRKTKKNTALFIAVTSAAIWMLMPLLASASLLIVQRMTTLSATFMLFSSVAYLYARRSIENDTNKALTRMSLALLIGTTLAILTKENGALLPTLVLAMEATILDRPISISLKKWRIWRFTFLMVPTLLILGYLATRVPYPEELILRRDYSGWERLLTESRILWEYLINAFVPRPSQFGPFHDAYPVARTILNPLTFTAVFGWIVIASLALLWRRRYPIFSFAILWFLAGHLLESTVVPLELYFEHRNYVPIIAPIFAICFLAVHTPIRRKAIAYIGLPLYALVNAASLAGLTSLWGQPAVAAHFWHERQPDSGRAATHLASYYLAIHGRDRAIDAVHEFARAQPNDGYLLLQQLNLRCAFTPDGDHHALVSRLTLSLPDIHFTYSSASVLSLLATNVSSGKCNDVDLTTVKMLAQTVLRNPRYAKDVMYNQIHHQIMAQVANLQGNHEDAIDHLKMAISIRPDSEINTKVVTSFAAMGRFEQARSFIEKARANAPLNPLKRYEWISNLDDLNIYIDEIEQQTDFEN